MPHTSKISFSAANVVMSPLSNGGETSTMSRPTNVARSVALARRSRACRVESPPADGISVPGANAGSRASMSNETWTFWPASRSAILCAERSGSRASSWAEARVAPDLRGEGGDEGAVVAAEYRQERRGRDLRQPVRNTRPPGLDVRPGVKVSDVGHAQPREQAAVLGNGGYRG